MRPDTDETGRTSSQILPLVIAAFAGATLAIACERPESRIGTADGEPQARLQARAPDTPQNPAPTTTPPVAAAPNSTTTVAEATSDTVITGRVKTAILADPAMNGADVSVNTDRGVVTLTGTVKSHEQAGIASSYAQRQDGVMRVDSHIAWAQQ